MHQTSRTIPIPVAGPASRRATRKLETPMNRIRSISRFACLLAELALAGRNLLTKAAEGEAPPDMVTQWNLTMTAGLEAAAIPPPPAARIGAIVQASVFDAVNGIERRYAFYHGTPRCFPRRRRGRCGIHHAGRPDPGAEAPIRRPARRDAGPDLRRPVRPGTIDPTRARPGTDRRHGHPHLAGNRRVRGAAAVCRRQRARRLAADPADVPRVAAGTAVPPVRRHDPVCAHLACAVPAVRPAAPDQRPLRP